VVIHCARARVCVCVRAVAHQGHSPTTSTHSPTTHCHSARPLTAPHTRALFPSMNAHLFHPTTRERHPRAARNPAHPSIHFPRYRTTYRTCILAEYNPMRTRARGHSLRARARVCVCAGGGPPRPLTHHQHPLTHHPLPLSAAPHRPSHKGAFPLNERAPFPSYHARTPSPRRAKTSPSIHTLSALSNDI